MHGSLWEVSCWDRCSGAPERWEDRSTRFEVLPPRCPHCGGHIRPGVVWFGESLDPEVLDRCDTAQLRHLRHDRHLVGRLPGRVPRARSQAARRVHGGGQFQRRHRHRTSSISRYGPRQSSRSPLPNNDCPPDSDGASVCPAATSPDRRVTRRERRRMSDHRTERRGIGCGVFVILAGPGCSRSAPAGSHSTPTGCCRQRWWRSAPAWSTGQRRTADEAGLGC